jgi:hypothetical protein
MFFNTVVHTTGLNWDAVLANAASIIVILGAFGAIMVRVIKHSIKDQIEEVIKTDVTPLLTVMEHELRVHDTRIARLEGVEEGKRQAIAAAGVTSGSPKSS